MGALYWVTEGVRLRVRGGEPAAYLNGLARQGVVFSDAGSREGEALELTVSCFGEKRALALAAELGISVEVLRRRGLLGLLRRLRGRWLLASLPLLLLAAVFRLSSYIWELDVVGNVTLTEAEIRSALEETGVGIGTRGYAIDNELVRSRMQEKLGRLIWLTVHVRGSRAEVVVRERREPPPLVDEKQAADVVAAKTGLVEKLSVLEGLALVRRGDTVLAGQTLITGLLTDRQAESRSVHALGEIWARTWYEDRLCMPLLTMEKEYTGEETVKTALILCNFRVNLYFDSGISYARYDKITEEVRPTLFGFSLPFSIRRERYAEYKPISRETEREEAEAQMQARLLARVHERSGGAELTETLFESAAQDGLLLVSVTAECREQIGTEKAVP